MALGQNSAFSLNASKQTRRRKHAIGIGMGLFMMTALARGAYRDMYDPLTVDSKRGKHCAVRGREEDDE